MTPLAIKLLKEIRKDVTEIKTQIISLRIRVASTAAVVAIIVTLVTGLIFNALMVKEPAHGSIIQPTNPVAETSRSQREVERQFPPLILGGR